MNRTANELAWGDALILEQIGFAKQDRTLTVPKVGIQKGAEQSGIKDFEKICGKLSASSEVCDIISLYSLDHYVATKLHGEKVHIDYLSIEVEEYDYDVIMGAKETLPLVSYLEFEYNSNGPWKEQSQ